VYLAVVGFLVMLIGLPGAYDVNSSVVRSRINNSVNGRLNVPKRHEAEFAIILAIIDHFEYFVLEDRRRAQERNFVVLDVRGVFVVSPSKLQFAQRRHPIIYTYVYTYQC